MWTSLDYPCQVTVTLAYMEGGGDSGYIPGLSMDGHSHSGIRRYSDMGGGGGGGEGRTSLDYPWMVRVTLAYRDTLTWWGGWTSLDYPWMVAVTLASADGHGYFGIHGYSDMGGEGWTSLDYPWMVRVTPA